VTINQKVRNALKDFGLPISEDFHTGEEEEYITFNLDTDEATEYADDVPIGDTAHMQIHWILPVTKNYLSGKKKIRKMLHENGFTYPKVDGFVEPGNKVRHIVFICDIENDEELEE
jgi:hypothetical protein